MSASFDPAPRPALRRAPDRAAHPTAPVVPPAPVTEAAAKPRKDKLVKLKVEVPRSLREGLVDEARRRGLTLDELVSLILRSRQP